MPRMCRKGREAAVRFEQGDGCGKGMIISVSQTVHTYISLSKLSILLLYRTNIPRGVFLSL